VDETKRARLGEIMGALRTDRAALVPFYLEFGDEVRRVVRHLVHRRERFPDDDDLENITFDACAALATAASGWRPDGGALPWVWGRARIERVVNRHFGPLTRPLPSYYDQEERTMLAAHDDSGLGTALATLARRDNQCALLLDALEDSVSPEDAEVLLLYRVQQQSGDPAPADTVGRALGLKPPTVRQRASRARRRLAATVARDARFAGLADIDLLTTARRPAEVAA
jgi:DNA-directed RNA polymerase specialized sigma24 family protein